MTRTVLLGSALLVAMGALSGCSDLSKALGLVKSPPDEFTVVAGVPLALPPDYGLRPPHTSGKPDSGETVTDKARQAVFRMQDSGRVAQVPAPGSAGSTQSAGEHALLAKAGAAEVDPAVRARIDQESRQALDADKGFINDLMFWKGTPVPGEALDAQKEAQRLSQSNAAGNAVQIDRTQHSDLEGKL